MYIKGATIFNGRFTKGVPVWSKMICKKKGFDIGAGPDHIKQCWVAKHQPKHPAPPEVESSIGIRQLSYSTLVVVLSSHSLYSKFFFLHTQAINIGMKFYHHGKKGIFEKPQKVCNSVRWKEEHEQDGRVHCVEASAKANLILQISKCIKIMKRVHGLQTRLRNSTWPMLWP